MSDLISRDALFKAFERAAWYNNADRDEIAEEILLQMPAVDAVPVVHGRWLGTHDGWYFSYSCSECGAEALTKEETMHDQVCSAYCPNCGAKMDGGVDDG